MKAALQRNAPMITSNMRPSFPLDDLINRTGSNGKFFRHRDNFFATLSLFSYVKNVFFFEFRILVLAALKPFFSAPSFCIHIKNVILLRTCEKMVRIYTAAIITFVASKHPDAKRPIKLLVGHSGRSKGSPSAIANVGVTVATYLASPIPAASFRVFACIINNRAFETAILPIRKIVASWHITASAKQISHMSYSAPEYTTGQDLCLTWVSG